MAKLVFVITIEPNFWYHSLHTHRAKLCDNLTEVNERKPEVGKAQLLKPPQLRKYRCALIF